MSSSAAGEGRSRAPAAEMQLELLPPRWRRVTGGRLAASVLPAYDVGGDWFDHAENPDGVWLALGDAMGKGIRAAAMSAVSIGALRSARREGGDAQACCHEMHCAIQDLGRARIRDRDRRLLGARRRAVHVDQLRPPQPAAGP